MKRKGLILVLVFALVLGVVQVAGAADDKTPAKSQGKMIRFNILEELDLTDEQVEQWKEIREQAYEDSRDLRIQMMDLLHELELLMISGDEDGISDKQDEIQAVREKIMEIQKSCQEDLHDNLTDEQKDILEEKGVKGFGLGMGFGKGPGPGHVGFFKVKWQGPNDQTGNED